MDARDFYDGLGDDYDRMVSWKGRLAREEAFFQRLFEENGVRQRAGRGMRHGNARHRLCPARDCAAPAPT